MFSKRRALSLALGAVLVTAGWAARKPGQPLRPGFNFFSKAQDIELGEANAKQVTQQYPAVANQNIQAYVRRVGERLASATEAKQSGFPFRFTVLHVGDVNAFALPGGPMFVFTGLLKVCDNEAQLAGVMGHEMSHVILRHGTHEASKANLFTLPALLAGAAIGTDSGLGQLANLGLGLGANSVILKFSRDAESEADALGSHLMAESGYDPVEMARFFQKLGEGPQPPQFFSDHPNPGNREKAIRAELQTLPRRTYGYETGEFARVKSMVAALPPPPKPTPAGQPAPAPPAGTWRDFRGQGFALSYPGNWQVFGESGASSVTLAPRDGVVSQNGASQIGLGAIVSVFKATSSRDARGATDDLVRQLQAQNPQMRATTPGQPRNVTVAGLNGLVTTLSNPSPFGGNETDALLTVMRPEGLFYVVFIAPEKQYPQLQDSFQKMMDSLRFTQ